MKTIARTARGALWAAVIIAFVSISCAGSPASQPSAVTLPGISTYALSDPLPLAPELLKKTLPNGLTYYVRANGNPGGRVVMYLTVAGGSSVENDDERGYAHFIEHMAFNGTSSYPENELVKYLRLIGMEFGAEVNAYTAIEETVYTLEMPTDNPAHFETGLKVLREWASAITLDPMEVEKEKGVILEERRLGLGASEQARKAELPVLLAGSRQAMREPIGTEASILGADATRLKAFYDRAYRPDRMAVMIVGDIDPVEASAAVEREFSPLVSQGGIQPRPFFPVTPTREMRFVSTYNKEFDPSVIFYEKIVPLQSQQTIADYNTWLKNNLASAAVSLRLSDLTRAGGKAWAEAFFDDDYFYGMTRIFAFTLSAKNGSELEAFSELAIEVERLRRYGFTDSEFKRTIDNWRRWLTTLDVEDQDLKSGNFAQEYVRNFMYDEPVPGVVNERVYIKDALDGLTLQDLNEAARTILAEDEGYVAVRAMAAPTDSAMNEDAFRSSLETARASAIEALAVSDTPSVGLFDGEPEGGTIVSEVAKPNNITELVLSNGARVLIKPTTYDKDSVNFVGWSLGGYSALPPEDYYSAAFAPTLLGAAGLGDMDATQLEEATALANVGLSWNISENGTSLSGKSATADLRTLLRLVYLTAAEQGKDQTAFSLMKDRLAAQIGPYVLDPGYRFETAWSSHLFGGNPRTAVLDPARVKALGYEKVRAAASDALAAASRFTYILVGDVSLPEAKKLVAKYLGAIPSGSPWDTQWRQPLQPRKEAGTRVDFPFSRENRASVRMVWAAEAPWSWEREQTLNLLAQALNNRLLDAIREDLGGTYVVSTNGAFSRLPLEQYALVVSFDCDPTRVDELIAEVRAEVAILAGGSFDPMYVQQIKAAAQREYDGTNRTNTYWVRNLANAAAYGLDYEIQGRARRRIELADGELFRALAEEILSPEREFDYVMTPEK